jgi:hypothetical protein
MFAYCGNNPVNRCDYSGLFWEEIGAFFVSVAKVVSTVAVLAGAVLTSSGAVVLGHEKHYARNNYNTIIIETIDQIPDDWTTSNTTKYPERKAGAAANAHQHTALSKDQPNTKFSSPDKHEEVIFSYEEELVDNPLDMGTYNFGPGWISHWYLDVVPWIWWGNSPEDSSIVWDRACSLVWGAN